MKKDNAAQYLGCILIGLLLWAEVHEASALIGGPLAAFASGYLALTR